MIRAGSFGRLVQDQLPVRNLITRYIETLWAESQQLSACNAAHDASERLCRWLLQCADHTHSNQLPLTQELLSEMLGVRRTTVTILAQSLQREGIIKYSRGHLEILDRQKLEHGACECYAIIRRERHSREVPMKVT
jgi:CRP-like cAMP-binding protein